MGLAFGWRRALAGAAAAVAGCAFGATSTFAADPLGSGPACRGGGQAIALPATALALRQSRPLRIVAIGSSSTEGVGAREPGNAYPARLEADLRTLLPGREIVVVNKGIGGEDVVEMMARFERDVVAEQPDLVIWQVASNAMMRGVPAERVGAEISRGLARIREIGADALLMTPQYAPRINGVGQREKMLSLLTALARIEGAALFPRYEIMQDWREGQALPFAAFLTEDGLHLNDWGYACTARLLSAQIGRAVVSAPVQTAGGARR
ncbi:MAG: SGNH/GDSL hydrolase family protein [Methylobacteriaceae bacterium]|nr:SGNH/GDSL hydrolase family protein [Methylobacteriaceae bacterium]